MDLLETAMETWRQGGAVVPWLAVCTVVLWFAIGERAYTLRKSWVKRESSRRLKGVSADRSHRREALAPVYADVARHRALILGIGIIAPLLGLLGTVGGMIETFDALTSMSLFRGSGGVAGGISEALVSTQMGLTVAIPGLLAGRLLDAMQSRREEELDLALSEVT